MSSLKCVLHNNLLDCWYNDIKLHQAKNKDQSETYNYFECDQDSMMRVNTLCRNVSEPTNFDNVKWLKQKDRAYIILGYEYQGNNVFNLMYNDLDELSLIISKYFDDQKVMKISVYHQDFLIMRVTHFDINRGSHSKNNIYNKLHTKYNDNYYLLDNSHICIYREGENNWTVRNYDIIIESDNKNIAMMPQNITLYSDPHATTPEQSKICINLQWNSQSCWMDASLVNIFTFKTAISEKIINTINGKSSKSKFDIFIINILSRNNLFYMKNIITELKDYCDRTTSIINLDEVKTLLNCSDFVSGSISSASTFLIILNNIYGLNIKTWKINPHENLLFSDIQSNIQSNQLITERTARTKFLIIDMTIFVNTLSSISNKYDIVINGVINSKVLQININGIIYMLFSTIVYQDSYKHYKSIVYDPKRSKYTLIDKLTQTLIDTPTVSDWKNSIYLFYYPEELIKRNIITNIQNGTIIVS